MSTTINSCIPKTQPEQINVLWLVAEDLSSMYLSMYGDSSAFTPNLNRLADEGVVYTNAYSVSGVCSPSRFTLATGVYPNSAGAHNMRTLVQQPSAREKGLIDYQVVLPKDVKMVSEILRLNGFYTSNNDKEDYQFFKSELAWDESSKFAHWRNRLDKDIPFFSVFNFFVTHESNMWNFDFHLSDESIFPPDRNGSNSNSKRNDRDEYPLLFHSDTNIVIPPYLPQNEVGVKTMQRLYTNIMRLDKGVGKILDQLEEDGLLDNTIIFFYSDHGGPLPRQKRLLYDSGLKVPLIIRYPNKMRAGTIDDRLISFVDFPATLLSLANIEPPDFMQGQAFEGKYRSNTERQYVHAHADRFDESTDMIRAIRDERYKYLKNYYPDKPYYLPLDYRENMEIMKELLQMRNSNKLDANQALWFRQEKDYEELFDTQNDPHELNNIANDATYNNLLVGFRNELDRWTQEIDDKGNIQEIDLISEFYPGGKAQLTQMPKVNINDGIVTLENIDSDLSIGYKFSSEIKPSLGWKHYDGPIKESLNDTLKIVAHKVGYKYGIINIFNGQISQPVYPNNRHDLNE
ncbi:MAG: sulfatase [Bacteroidetes bacterium]|nr:sulfatase [Bacteroidota bacterium]